MPEAPQPRPASKPSLPSVDLTRLATRIALAYVGRQGEPASPFAELCRTAYRSLLACAPHAGPAHTQRLPARPARRRASLRTGLAPHGTGK